MQQSPPALPPRPTSGLAISSLVLGILSCTLLGFLAGIPAIICGHSARRKARVAPFAHIGSGLAIAGLVLGYIGTVLSAILLIAVFIPAAVYKLGAAEDQARMIRAEGDLQSISMQLHMYQALNGTFPTTQQGLSALVQQPTTEPVPARWTQFLAEVPKDPWGSDYGYKYPGSASRDRFELSSAGPDRVADTADDIRR